MRPTDRSLLSDLPAESLVAALASWRWLLGEDLRPRWLSLSGDVFLVGALGEVFWLDTGGGTLTRIAASEQELEERLAEAVWRDEWLLESVIEERARQGRVPGAGECLGFRILPVLGGAYDGENRVVVAGAEHVGLTGELHRQIRDLPDGTAVRLEIVD
ncbi:MAG TPA: T6SS immunity protein Tdi1 domain-containing protein [Candidatus Eisenbacteria bacterium]|nr:T6SS immunity protein Tdi1 domain-containing protein [Candidatus Eisenbacteria bacterium]